MSTGRADRRAGPRAGLAAGATAEARADRQRAADGCLAGSQAPLQSLSVDLLILNAGELLTCPAERRGLGVGLDGAVAVKDGRIAWVGTSEEARRAAAAVLEAGGRVDDAGGVVVMPGLIDCHTHLVFGGDRAAEFQRRVAGASYEQIAAEGGGIMSTVRATRAASTAELRESALGRLRRLLSFGVTTVEAKSGYGLSLEDESRLLQVAADVGRAQPVDVVATFLGAHSVPAEYRERGQAGRRDYLQLVVQEMIPAVADQGIAKFCDAFCEPGIFSVEECRQVLEAGVAAGLRPKLHAEQLSVSGGAKLAGELRAVSADHLDFVDQSGIDALAAAGVVAVLLPGAAFFLGGRRFAPARALLSSGAHIALSTDLNPGTSPTENLWLMASMGCCLLRMTAEEVIRAITCEAARALGMEAEVGSLEVGKRADILILEARDHLQLPYHYGVNPVSRVYKDGVCVVDEHRCEDAAWQDGRVGRHHALAAGHGAGAAGRAADHTGRAPGRTEREVPATSSTKEATTCA